MPASTEFLLLHVCFPESLIISYPRAQCCQLRSLTKKKESDGNKKMVDILKLSSYLSNHEVDRPLLLGYLDSKVQLHLKKVREIGGTINTRIAMSAARGLVLHYNPSLLKEHSGHAELSRNWALSLLEQMKFVKRRATIFDFREKKQAFLRKVGEKWL